MRYDIKWEKGLNDYFIHGSKLSFFKEDDEVHFENPYLSPGSVIVKWYSEVNFQGARTGLQLPLLKRGEMYRLEPEIMVYPEASAVVKFVVYDRAGTLLKTQIVPLTGGEVTYIPEAYSYSIELINTGVETLCFKSIHLIQEGG